MNKFKYIHFMVNQATKMNNLITPFISFIIVEEIRIKLLKKIMEHVPICVQSNWSTTIQTSFSPYDIKNHKAWNTS